MFDAEILLTAGGKRSLPHRGKKTLPSTPWMAPTESEFQSARPRWARLLALVVEGVRLPVSIRAPAMGATSYVEFDVLSKLFQSARPRWARRVHLSLRLRRFPVSIRAPAMGATPHPVGAVRDGRVSIRAPAMGATTRTATAHESCSFQSARPRWARRGARAVRRLRYAVSIRAPAMGETGGTPWLKRLAKVSIRAPAMGATAWPHRALPGLRCFNPRARDGRDARRGQGVGQSPTFQSARPRWAQPATALSSSVPSAFQSARPRWARLQQSIAEGSDDVFQSARPRWARPEGEQDALDSVHVSIRAPAMGATCMGPGWERTHEFQSARPRWARRPTRRPSSRPFTGFNPRARDGRDHDTPTTGGMTCQFQSARPRWARQLHAVARDLADRVSIRAPAMGATSAPGHEQHGRQVSIRAPAMGATRGHLRAHGEPWVSIRAPAMGATSGC